MEESKLQVCRIKRKEHSIGKFGREIDNIWRSWWGVERNSRLQEGSNEIEREEHETREESGIVARR